MCLCVLICFNATLIVLTAGLFRAAPEYFWVHRHCSSISLKVLIFEQCFETAILAKFVLFSTVPGGSFKSHDLTRTDTLGTRLPTADGCWVQLISCCFYDHITQFPSCMICDRIRQSGWHLVGEANGVFRACGLRKQVILGVSNTFPRPRPQGNVQCMAFHIRKSVIILP
jgi:hypothetical protein